jgi:hypothetical protein
MHAQIKTQNTHGHGIHGSDIYTHEHLMYNRRGNDVLYICVFVAIMIRVRVGVTVAGATGQLLKLQPNFTV